MSAIYFNVNTSSLLQLTDRLERLNKHAFPSAVRATLSDGAFEMKKKNILESAKKNMNVKAPNFFKANTGVQRAKFSSKIETMKAVVGFVNKKGRTANKAVTQGMIANEVGGDDDDGLMYMPATRISKNKLRMVRKKSRYQKSNIIKGRVRTKKRVSNTMNMISSFEEKKPTFVKTKKGKFLVQVLKMKHDFARNKPVFTLDFLMRDRKQHTAKTNATHFNREAAEKTQKQMEGFYKKNAEYQFNKAMK